MYIPSAREALLERVAALSFKLGKTQVEIGRDPEVCRLADLLPDSPRRPGAFLSQSTVNRLIQRARELGVVAISVDRSFAIEPVEDADKSDRLRRAFGLHACTVVDVPAASPDLAREDPAFLDSGMTPSQAVEAVADARTILALANCAALKAQSTWAAGNHIGCGGGRTICWFARAVRRNPPHTPNLTFTPLSGRLWVDDWRLADADLMERPLDAADAVHILSEAFEEEEGGRFSQNNLPLYGAKAKEAMGSGGCALGLEGAWNWGLPALTHAYLGVGSLGDSGHRLAVCLARHPVDGAPPVGRRPDELSQAVKTLREIVDACRGTLTTACDLGNRLFAALPLPGDLPHGSLDERLTADVTWVAALIDRLNLDAAVMSWLHLRRAANVHVIGGGRNKRPALWTLLLSSWFDARRSQAQGSDRSPIVTQLTTDSATADALLAAAAQVQENPDMREKYQHLCQDVGLAARFE